MAETATPMDSFTEMTEVLLPDETNELGRALGGTVLHWMDRNQYLLILSTRVSDMVKPDG